MADHDDRAGSVPRFPPRTGPSPIGLDAAGLAVASVVPPEPLPAPTGPSPYRLDLAEVLDPAQMQAITDAGRLTFHLLGDVGGVKAPQDQQIVALNLTADAHRATDPARFAYIMGDVVYHNGDDAQYYPQFYEPYATNHARSSPSPATTTAPRRPAPAASRHGLPTSPHPPRAGPRTPGTCPG